MILKRKKNPIFGIVLSNIEEGCQSLIFSGIYDVARENDINLLTFIGSSQRHIKNINLHYQTIDSFINENNIDGLIFLTGPMLDRITDTSIIESIVLKAHNIPRVNISIPFGDIPTIMIDNKAGIYDAVNHLIHVHNYKKIAFIKGTEHHDEAISRFQAYCNALTQNNIDIDPKIIFPGNFTEDAGIEAANRILYDNLDIDAIIAVDDETALGALKVFIDNDINVPDEIALIGFDDIDKATLFTPSLSTIKQPLYEQGKVACETLLKMIHNEPVSKKIVLPTKLIIRESCGCKNRANDIFSMKYIRQQANNFDKDKLINQIMEEVRNLDKDQVEQHIHNLLNIITEPIDEEKKHTKFLMQLKRFIFFIKKTSNLYLCRNIFTIFFTNLAHHYVTENNRVFFKNVYQETITILNNQIIKELTYQGIMKEHSLWELREVGHFIISTFNIDDLIKVLYEKIMFLKVSSCYVVLYKTKRRFIPDSPWKLPKKSELIFAINDRKEVIKPGKKVIFDTKDILPFELYNENKNSIYIFLALHYFSEHFGYVLVELQSLEQINCIESLRIFISSSIKSSLMVNELVIKNKKLKKLSLNDELTGLYNRRGFITLGNQFIKEAHQDKKHLLLVYADLDGLKKINDTFGHEAGDAAIIATSNVLKQSFREEDIIARMGGDEFTVLALNLDSSHIESLRNRIYACLDEYNRTSGKPYEVSFSIGISEYDYHDNMSFKELILIADKHLYQMKKLRKQKKTSNKQDNT